MAGVFNPLSAARRIEAAVEASRLVVARLFVDDEQQRIFDDMLEKPVGSPEDGARTSRRIKKDLLRADNIGANVAKCTLKKIFNLPDGRCLILVWPPLFFSFLCSMHKAMGPINCINVRPSLVEKRNADWSHAAAAGFVDACVKEPGMFPDADEKKKLTDVLASAAADTFKTDLAWIFQKFWCRIADLNKDKKKKAAKPATDAPAAGAPAAGAPAAGAPAAGAPAAGAPAAGAAAARMPPAGAPAAGARAAGAAGASARAARMLDLSSSCDDDDVPELPLRRNRQNKNKNKKNKQGAFLNFDDDDDDDDGHDDDGDDDDDAMRHPRNNARRDAA
jgi:hypothetical protein